MYTYIHIYKTIYRPYLHSLWRDVQSQLVDPETPTQRARVEAGGAEAAVAQPDVRERRHPAKVPHQVHGATRGVVGGLYNLANQIRLSYGVEM